MEKADKTADIYTIGHSTRPFEDFLEALKSFRIEVLADVRSYPGSRKYPQYNKETLEKTIPAAGMEYLHLPLLGGRRKVRKDSENNAWRHPAFRGYADYMESEEFEEGMKNLMDLADKKRVAYMCSEAVWWRCHRSMISDYLKIRGWKVLHIMAPDKAQEHPYTSAARVEQGQLSYHAENPE